MGCGCGGKKNTTTTWTLTKPNGNSSVHRSQVEARAQDIRTGGGGTITAKQS